MMMFMIIMLKWMKGIYSGELLTDSLKLGQEDKPYYTLVKKREVFAGGGIAPDVIVPLDTSYANMYVAVLRQYVQGFTSNLR
jgi:hypothetical protein